MEKTNNIELKNSSYNNIIQDTNGNLIIINQYGQPIVFPQNLNGVPVNIVPLHYVDRAEVDKINCYFEQSTPIILINGEGGIGKTTLAAKYLDNEINNYKHFAWINCEYNIENEILDLFRFLGIEIKDIPTEKKIQWLIFALNGLAVNNKCLLILDNANNEEQLRTFLKKFGALTWHTIITSRCNNLAEIKNIIRIEHLPSDKAKQLFTSYYTENSDNFNEQIEIFLKYIAYNSLLITLFAKYLAICNEFRIGKYPLKQLNNAFLQYGLFVASTKKIEYCLTEVTVNELLKKLYNLSELNDNQKNILFFFSFLPLLPISFTHLLQLLNIKSEAEDEFEQNIRNLVKAGWLLQTQIPQSETAIKINSPILQNFLIENCKTEIWNKILPYVKTLIYLLNIDNSNSNYIVEFQWIDYGFTLLQTLKQYSFLNVLCLKPEISKLQNNLALQYSYIGNYERARELLELLLKYELENFGEIHPNVAVIQSNLANVYCDLGDYEKARLLLVVALKSISENFGEKHPNFIANQSILGKVYIGLGEYVKARDVLELSLKSNLEKFGEKHPIVGQSLNNLGEAYRELGEYEKARDLLELALKNDLENFSDKHPEIAKKYSNLSLVYKYLGANEKACELLELALKSDLANFGEKHPNVARCQSNLALVYRELGNFEKARNLLELALKSTIDTFGEKNANVAVIQSNLGEVYRNLGDYEKARDLLELALNYNIENFGAKHSNTAIFQNNLAWIFIALKENKKAIELWENAYSILVNTLGLNHNRTKSIKNFIKEYKS